MSYEELVVGHILPVVRLRRVSDGDYQPLVVQGTGFTFGEGTFVTCWHCVDEALRDDEVYGIVTREGGLASAVYNRAFELADLGRDLHGTDLALARVGFNVAPRLRLADRPLAWGEDVVTSGYPLPINTVDPNTRLPLLQLHARLLRGYVTRLFSDDRPGWAAVRAVELDLPAPPGLSGAPLFRPDPFEVAGVVYREHDIEVPEAQRSFTFSVAHHLSTVRGASGLATSKRALADHLERSS